MDVAMEDRLAGHLAGVHADVKALHRRISGQRQFPELSQQLVACCELGRRQTEVVLHVPPGNHESVTWGYRKAIENSVGEIVLEHDSLGSDIAKKAGGLMLFHLGSDQFTPDDSEFQRDFCKCPEAPPFAGRLLSISRPSYSWVPLARLVAIQVALTSVPRHRAGFRHLGSCT